MIQRIENPLLLPKILSLAKAIDDMPIEKLEKMLVAAFTSKDARVYVDEKDNEVRGYIFGTIEQLDGEDCVFIQSCAIKPEEEERYVGFELLTKMKLWAKERGLHNLYMMTKRNQKAFEKKYHFEFAYSVLKKGVDDERNV